MNKRLVMAKKLLSNEGVIFISIDDNEQAQLKLLCDQVFGEKNFITNFIWKKKDIQGTDANHVSVLTEYVIAYAKNKENLSFTKNTISLQGYIEEDDYVEKRGKYKLNKLDRGTLGYSESLDFGIKSPDGSLIFPNGRTKKTNDGWRWRWSLKKVLWGIEKGFIEFKETKKGKYSVYYKMYEHVNNNNEPFSRNQEQPKGNLMPEYTGKTVNGTLDIKNIFGGKVVFNYSKPKELVKYLISMHPNRESLVLDFFAGSGTTGHAVMELNKEDGGSRQFILATNNEVSSDKEMQLLIDKGLVPQSPVVRKGQPLKEWKQAVSEFKETSSYQEFLKSDDYNNLGIARQVTYERLKRVINGYTTPKGKVVDGLPNNLKHIVLETVSNLDAKKGVYSQKDVVFFIENVMEDLDAEYFKGESKDKLVYLVGEEEMESLLNQLKESPTDKEVIIYTNIGAINQYKQLEKGFTFKKFPKL